MTKTLRKRPAQAGFSLIEVLVTMVILALGLLGFAGLQAHSLKSNRTALQRSYATLLAYDIIDCMRVNRAAAVGSNGANDSAYRLAFTDTATNAAVGSLAAADVTRWLAALNNSLPGASARIVDTAQAVTTDPLQVTVQIRWAENVNSDRTLTFSTDTSL